MTACLLLMALFMSGCRQTTVTVPDFEDIQDTEERKIRFFSFMTPFINEENERIVKQREKLLRLYEKNTNGSRLFQWDRRWLDRLANEYGLDGREGEDPYQWQTLLRRVDIVPPDLALIQAAKESAWGGSRFVKEGYSMFGEHCFDKKCGIVPDKRDPGAEHEVKAFTSAAESVRSYIHNLNTNSAYSNFRSLRFRLRSEGREPDGYSLAGTLLLYSERGEAYINEIRRMLKENRHLMGRQ